MSKLSNLTNEITELADNDLLYVWDASTPANPDAKMLASRLRPVGARVTNFLRYESDITIPALVAATEADATIAVAGALVDDHVVFNFSVAPPANIAILAVWAEADAVKVRFRNTHAATDFVTADVACVALISRSTD